MTTLLTAFQIQRMLAVLLHSSTAKFRFVGKKITTSFPSTSVMKKLNSLFARKIVSFCECYLDNFELLQAGIIGKYHIQVMLLFLCNRS